jgi:broad specificity phosphatase PhoE
MKSNVNFAFIRHGYGCHNAISGLIKSELISLQDGLILSGKSKEKSSIIDPVLTQVGVDASIHNGCVVNKIFKSIDQILQINYNDSMNMDKIDVIGCSPLIRCMETAYYMSRSWPNPPSKIYVFPFLREIDERSDNKFSFESRITMNSKPFYAMKTIEEQKKYLDSLGILNFFDFSFVEKFKRERAEPGDIDNFMKWFFVEKKKLKENKENLNVFIVTHAGVLNDFADDEMGFINNSGFVINTFYDEQTFTDDDDDDDDGTIYMKKYISLNPFLDFFNFYKDYKSTNVKEYYCPSNRCGTLCSVMNDKDKKDTFTNAVDRRQGLEHINVTCDINKKIDIPSLLKILNLTDDV